MLWLKEGDLNTKFFHRVAVVNRRRNFIEFLVVDGVRIEGEEEVKWAILGSMRTYTKRKLVGGRLWGGIEFNHIGKGDSEWLERAFEEEEVHEAMSSCVGDTAPGPDGFSLAFFQLYSRRFLTCLFRPPSMHLKKVLDVSVSSSQNVFVEGRQILDAALVANELVEFRRKNRDPDLLCKLDLEKAFDHVNLEFLDFIMMQIGFGARWRG
uniref:Reverse transcriptase domain-containing protein n=1 Tax=Nicotiana tabacum TaxID=4097 RepID=A0A1S4AUP7_TOBAC|nr:PREDICTED: uncharacterized protein LOC107801479 [Nicotiana tabacum]